MTLGGEMNNSAWLVLPEELVQQFPIGNAAMYERVLRVAIERCQVLQVPGVSQAIEVDHRLGFTLNPLQDKVRPNEACASRH